jgi:hypothetical protein
MKRFIFFVLALSLMALQATQAQTPKRDIELPNNFRQQMTHYATVDRADGKVYELFINQLALQNWRTSRQLPTGSLFVIESFYAQKNAAGNLLRDAQGRLIKGASENELHLSEKQNRWANNGECTSPSLMNGRPNGQGQWRMAAFDPRNGQRIVQATQKPALCVQCHQDRRAEDFLLSRGLLDSFSTRGRTAHISFSCGEREICFGGEPRPLSAPEPVCSDSFRAGSTSASR